VAKLKHGSNQHTEKKEEGSHDPSSTIDAAAAIFQVSAPSVKRAKHVLDRGDKAVVEAVKRTL
jgi:hypothetical protein